MQKLHFYMLINNKSYLLLINFKNIDYSKYIYIYIRDYLDLTKHIFFRFLKLL